MTMNKVKIAIEDIANGFLVSVYNGDSVSAGSYTIYCETWREVNAAINQWIQDYATWLLKYKPK